MNQNNWDQAVIVRESLLVCSSFLFSSYGKEWAAGSTKSSSPGFACYVTGEVAASLRGKGSSGAGEGMHNK